MEWRLEEVSTKLRESMRATAEDTEARARDGIEAVQRALEAEMRKRERTVEESVRTVQVRGMTQLSPFVPTLTLVLALGSMTRAGPVHTPLAPGERRLSCSMLWIPQDGRVGAQLTRRAGRALTSLHGRLRQRLSDLVKELLGLQVHCAVPQVRLQLLPQVAHLHPYASVR